MEPKKIILAVLLAGCAGLLHAQIDFTRYFDEKTIPLVDPEDHLDINFTWNMAGNVQVFMNEGINYLKEGDLKLAISNFDSVIKIDSLSSVAFYYRGICKKNLFQFDDAKKDLLRTMKIDPRQPTVYVELGELYHIENDFIKATKQYEKAIELDPQLVQAHYNLGSLALAKGDVRKGLKYYQKCNEINPKFPQAYMMQGIVKFLARKKDVESIALFDRAVAADSTYALSYFWRGLAYISLEKPGECLENWNALIRRDPENSTYILMRGCLYIELEDFDNAFNDLRKAIRARSVDDEQFKAGQTILDKRIDLQYAANYLITNGYGLDEKSFGFLKKGFCLLLAGKYDQSIAEIRKSEQMQPSATVYFIEALAYEHAGNHNLAFTYYNKALALDNDIFDAHKKRSVYRIELKDWKGANKDFDEMFRLQPKSPVVYRLRGISRSHEGNYAGAVDDLTKYIHTDSSDYESIRTRSVCLKMLGKQREANEDLRMLLNLEKNWELYETVAGNYIILKDTANAIEIWKEYANRNPRVFIPYMELARVYVQQRKWDSARVEIEKLLPIFAHEFMPKKYAEILYWQGRIDFEDGNYEAAIDKFSKSLKNNTSNLEAKYFRAQAYEKTQQFKRARADFKDLIDSRYKDAADRYSAIARQ
ncbi:MAG TPA: tetratricopeptide repeat protein [Chryseolinea sp.]